MTVKFSTTDRIANVHIPKTAGSTFRHQLAHHYDVLAVSPETADPAETDFYQGYQKQLIDLRPVLEAKERYFLTGHFRYRDIVMALDEFASQIALITFIRDPVQRTLSDYFYSFSNTHPDNEKFRSEYPTLESYIENAGQMNKQFMYLAPHENACVDETIAEIEKNFSFVGITELYAQCEREIFAELDLELPPPVHMNRGGDTGERSQSMELYGDLLAEAQHNDLALYNHFYRKACRPSTAGSN